MEVALAQERLGGVLGPGTLRRRLVLAVGVYVACTVVYFVCAPRQLLTELVRGDFDISAFGTVTARHGDEVLAFGHPLFSWCQLD